MVDPARERILDAAVPLLSKTHPTSEELRITCRLLGTASVNATEQLRRVSGRSAVERRRVLGGIYDAATTAPRVLPDGRGKGDVGLVSRWGRWRLGAVLVRLQGRPRVAAAVRRSRHDR